MRPRVREAKVRAVQQRLARWFLQHERDLPWRHTKDPYKILVSEIMLQQTQVDRVIPKYRAWLKQFPTVQRLARATPREVLLAWAGMGYNRRALSLHRAARAVVERFHGRVPTSIASLRTLPGVGEYTATAVATFATGVPHALADTNLRRVITRIFGGADALGRMRDAEILALVERTMPRRPVLGIPQGHWGHLVMDFGALVCKARPRCGICPVQRWCRAYPAVLRCSLHPPPTPLHPRRREPDRLYRGRIVQLVRDRDPEPVPVREIGPAILPAYTASARPWLLRLLRGLVRDGLLTRTDGRHAVALPRE